MIAILVLTMFCQARSTPPDVEAGLEQARALLDQSRPRQALEAARQVLLSVTVARLAGDHGGEALGPEGDRARESARIAARAEALIGRALRDLGRYVEAATSLSGALREMEQIESRRSEAVRESGRAFAGASGAERAVLQIDLAAVLIRCDRLDGARVLLDELAASLGNLPASSRDGLAVRLALVRGDLAGAAGDDAAARAAWGEGRDLARRLERPGDEVLATLRLAEGALASGDRAQAQSLFAAVASLAPDSSSPSWALALLGSVRAGEEGLSLGERLDRLEAAAGVLGRFGRPAAAAAAGLEAALLCLDAGLWERADELLSSVHERLGAGGAPCWLLGLETYARAERARRGGDPGRVASMVEGRDPEARIAAAFLPHLSLTRARALRDLGREAEMILAYERTWELLVRWRCAGSVAELPRGLRLEPRALAGEIAEAVLGPKPRTVLGRPIGLAYRALEGLRGTVSPGDAAGSVARSRTTAGAAADVCAAIDAWTDARQRWLMRPYDAGEMGLPDRELRDLEKRWSERRRAESLDPVTVCRLTGEAPSIARLRDVVQDIKTAYISFTMGEEASYGLAVARDRQVLVRLPGRDELSDRIGRFVARSRGDAGAGTEAGDISASLELLLVEPLIERLPSLVDRLLIAPDGRLAELPFEALRRTAEGAAPRYLGESYEVILVSSAAGFVASAPDRSPHQGGGGTVVTVGPARDGDGDSAGGRAVDLVERLVTKDACRALRGGSANRVELAAAVRRPCAVVQMAVASAAPAERNGWNVLPGDQSEISPAMVRRLGLETDLVFMIGPPLEAAARSELAGALLENGVRTVLTCRWEPDSEMAEYFLEAFYEGVGRGMTVSQSLRLARGTMLRRGGDAANPRAWAWVEQRGVPLSWVRLERRKEWLAPLVVVLLAGLFVATIVMFVMLRRLRAMARSQG